MHLPLIGNSHLKPALHIEREQKVKMKVLLNILRKTLLPEESLQVGKI